MFCHWLYKLQWTGFKLVVTKLGYHALSFVLGTCLSLSFKLSICLWVILLDRYCCYQYPVFVGTNCLAHGTSGISGTSGILFMRLFLGFYHVSIRIFCWHKLFGTWH